MAVHLCLDANDTTGWSWTSVASLLALLVAALAKVVSAGVGNDSASENALWADELDVLVLD